MYEYFSSYINYYLTNPIRKFSYPAFILIYYEMLLSDNYLIVYTVILGIPLSKDTKTVTQ